MHSLLLLSLLALGTDSHSIGYRNNLFAYAPARGEFPVQSARAQSYVRYLDNSGAERLLAFTYPEPLYGIRSTEQVNPQLRSTSISSSSSMEKQQQSQFASFRDWCEQRFNALRTELDRLRAEGKQPSMSILAQYEPLEQIIKMNAFEPVPGLTAEVQRARDEHLRIWHETRLQALRAEAGLPKSPQLTTINAHPIAYIPEMQMQPKSLVNRTKIPAFLTLVAPKPVQETDEVLRAREKHLQLYNETLSKLPQANLPHAPAQTQPQLQPEDPQIRAPLLPQPILPQAQPQLQPPNPQIQLPQQQPDKVTNNQLFVKEVDPLPVANVPSSIPLIYLPQPTTTIKANEQQIQRLQKDKLIAEDQLADIEDKIREEERDRDEKRRQEQDRLEELRLAELEAQREEQRILEEQRLLEAERISLQQAQLQRCQNERLEESKRLQAEQVELQQRLEMIGPIQTPADQQIKVIGQQPQPQLQLQPQPQSITQQQQVQNSFILRIQTPGQPFTDAYMRQPNPFLNRFILNPQLQEPQAGATLRTIPSPVPAPSDSTTSTTAFSELEGARREHFKAHEMALEQLRQANSSDAKLIP